MNDLNLIEQNLHQRVSVEAKVATDSVIYTKTFGREGPVLGPVLACLK